MEELEPLSAARHWHPRTVSVLLHQLRLQRAPHVQVERDRSTCKFWLEPLMLARNHGFAAHELTRIRQIVRQHHEQIMEAWHEHCGGP